ncbi:hypothetical protein QYE76_046711 [Lolium multiflorum]|uniref:Uncharacterized protein n=2 Tax=Lolium multiflorum TaxID=4521 RepID=A0AAD8X1B3_LOLMU|nr:hypothetical protein QYE76_046711 [Lolium multiflorum]
MPYDYCFKYTIIGDPGVGKTCLRLQFTDRTFQAVYEPTNDIDFGTRTVTVDDKAIRLEIWDTAGKGVCRPVIRQFYCRTPCIVLVYDITRRETFNHIAIWLDEAGEQSRADVTFLLIGNKCDLSNMRTVSYEEGQNFAKKHNLLYVEASAKTKQNVEEAFILAAKKIYKKVEDGALHLSQESILFLRLPENISPSQYGGAAGSSPWRLWTKFMGFVQSLNFLPKFTGSILHILSFLPKFLGFMHRLSFLLKFGTNAAWWPFSTPQLFSGCHSLPKDPEKELLLKDGHEV